MDLEQRTGLRFALEMGGAVLLLAGTVFLRDRLQPLTSDPLLHAALGLAPIVPVWLMLLASVRHYFRIDEFQRLRFLQIVALSTGILFCLHWSWPFAHKVFGLPELPDIASLPFSAIFVLVSAWFSRHHAAPHPA